MIWFLAPTLPTNQISSLFLYKAGNRRHPPGRSSAEPQRGFAGCWFFRLSGAWIQPSFRSWQVHTQFLQRTRDCTKFHLRIPGRKRNCLPCGTGIWDCTCRWRWHHLPRRHLYPPPDFKRIFLPHRLHGLYARQIPAAGCPAVHRLREKCTGVRLLWKFSIGLRYNYVRSCISYNHYQKAFDILSWMTYTLRSEWVTETWEACNPGGSCGGRFVIYTEFSEVFLWLAICERNLF